jgi:hypothetical protein
MKSIPTIISALLFSSSVMAYDNNPPIPERHTGWTTTGSVDSEVQFEVFYDLLCSGSAYMDGPFQDFLEMPFLGTTVKDAIKLTFTFFPLPYHHGSWLVTKLVPYFVDGCYSNINSC